MIRRQSTTRDTDVSNRELSAALHEVASLLQTQGANRYRVRAYERAAETIEQLPSPLWHTWKAEGVNGLMRLPGIGRSIARSLAQMLKTGRLPLLDRLRGEGATERLFATVADIGPKLAQRIHEELGIETLAELEAAANDGRLAQVAGMGKKRLRAVRESLSGRFQHSQRAMQGPRPEANASVPVSELLDIDRQYRELAAKNRLPRIAPRRFNPTAEAWLPVLHTERGTRHYTALFSNTAHAHELGATHDWVVIFRDDDGDQGQWTVITANFGKLRGKRIVRGREAECMTYYAQKTD